MKVFDYHCYGCDVTFESFVYHEDDYVSCPNCDGGSFFVEKLPSAPKLWYLKMGVDSNSMTTAADKWAKMHPPINRDKGE